MLTASQSSAALVYDEPDLDAPWIAPADFRAVYDGHAGFVWTNLRRLGVPASDLEDALQEVFVTAHRRAATLRPDASMRGWLYGILRRIAWRHRRSKVRRGRLREAIASAPAMRNDPERKLAGRQAATLVDGFLADLDEKQRDVFVLAELEEMTCREISETLGVKPNTVSSRLRAARQAFDWHFARLRAEDRRVAGTREALVGARTRQTPSSSVKARVMGAIAAQVGAPAAPLKLLPWLGGAMIGQAKVFAITVVVGLSGLAAIGYATAPARDEVRATAPERAATSGREASRDAVAARGPVHSPAEPARAVADATIIDDDGAAIEGDDAALEREPSRAASRRTSPTLGPTATRTAAAAPDSTLGEEARLLLAIQAARDAGNPARALRLADQHARQFPRGALAEERRALRLTLLCALGRDAQAQREAVALVHDRPASLLARRIATGCPREEG